MFGYGCCTLGLGYSAAAIATDSTCQHYDDIIINTIAAKEHQASSTLSRHMLQQFEPSL
jgi:hypothetical protein